MRWALALVAVVVLAGVPAMAAKGVKNAPKPNAISKADGRATFDKDKACVFKFPGNKVVRFTPADIGHLNEEERGKGCIIGKLETEKETKGGLAAGMYRVYMHKDGKKWEVFFCQKDEAIAQAEVEQGMDNEHDPRFTDGGHSIRYFTIKFSY